MRTTPAALIVLLFVVEAISGAGRGIFASDRDDRPPRTVAIRDYSPVMSVIVILAPPSGRFSALASPP